MKKFKFKINGNSYEVDINNVEGQIAEIEVNGTKYNVELDKEIPVVKTPKIVKRPLAQPKEGKPLTSDAKLSTIKAPLPGNILNVKIKEGDEVKKGDVLLIMEAMKMENNVLADVSGIVKSVKVKEGDTVLQNDLLVEIA
ncbi:MAG: acetyl-CoA carboxylase biotin carboxyl carrier protein subunit [Bacteroidales bacterium]|jgi:biotin carboxyl carrier protein|nr:acetyl-CoA carboxylase biotin carboxyl carrier protein subunit [Bacteroidales bacterium]